MDKHIKRIQHYGGITTLWAVQKYGGSTTLLGQYNPIGGVQHYERKSILWGQCNNMGQYNTIRAVQICFFKSRFKLMERTEFEEG